MSATNVLRQSHAAHLITDAAHYREDGVLLLSAPKVFSLVHLSAAVAVRGPWAGLPLIAECLAQATSYADLRNRCGDLLKDALEAVRQLSGGPLGAHADDVQIFVAGWSDDGPDAFTVISRSYGNDLPAWTPIPIADLCLAGGDPSSYQQCMDIVNGRTADEIDPRLDGLAIMEAQRRHKMTISDDKRFYAIGGFCQLTSVTCEKITTEILKRWPDVVGQPIQPKE